LEEINRYFTQLAEALACAHTKGVVHRDIKPSNALVDETGDVFLMDFGIAKIVESTIQLTATGAITGTPAYMSPEQG
jgi:serine/threonine protein kinase